MVEGGVGVLWRANGDNREVEISNRLGGDCSGNGVLLPFLIRVTNQESCPYESKADNLTPKGLCWFCLTGENEIINKLEEPTLAEYM